MLDQLAELPEDSSEKKRRVFHLYVLAAEKSLLVKIRGYNLAFLEKAKIFMEPDNLEQ